MDFCVYNFLSSHLKRITTYKIVFLTVTFFLLVTTHLFAQADPFAQGVQKYRQGDLEGAIADFELALSQEKENEKIKQYILNCSVTLAYRYMDRKNYAKALPYAERAYELDPSDESIKNLCETLKEASTPEEIKPPDIETKPIPSPQPEPEQIVVPQSPEAPPQPEVSPQPPEVSPKPAEVSPQVPEKKKKEKVAKKVVPTGLEKEKKKKRKPLDDPGKLRISQLLFKYRQGNFKEAFAGFEVLLTEYDDVDLQRAFTESLIGAATKLEEEKNYQDALTYAKRAYELNPNDTAVEKLYQTLLKQVEISEKR